MVRNSNKPKTILNWPPEPSLSCKVRIVAPYAQVHELKVKPEEAGQALIDFMHMRFPFHSRREWMDRFYQGLLYLKAQKIDRGTLLRGGEIIVHENPHTIEPSVPDEVKIIHYSRDWLAAYKPAPMPVHQGGRFNKNTLQSILETEGWGPLYVVHRLDAVTSGIVLFARNADWANRLSQAFQEKHVEKRYLAWVQGVPKNESWECELPIRRKKGFVFECGNHLEGAKPALSTFKRLKILQDESTSVVECNPVTGRTHQLRLHLAATGHPIMDDDIYNGVGAERQDRGISLVHAHLAIPECGIEVSAGL